MRRHLLLTASGLALLPAMAFASEVITYSYDVRGRLIQVVRNGEGNPLTSYSYDAADNRTNVTTTIEEDPASFAINDVSVTEGGMLTFTVSKLGYSATNVGVNWATANGTATAGSDYTAGSGSLTFTSAENSKSIVVQTLNDGATESAETVFVNLTNAVGGATIADAQGIGTINNGNSSPITQPDSVNVVCNNTATINVVANDSDPEGNTPLTLVSVAVDSGDATATVSSATSIQVFGAMHRETATATYTVKDSLNATSTGTLTIKSVGSLGLCLS